MRDFSRKSLIGPSFITTIQPMARAEISGVLAVFIGVDSGTHSGTYEGVMRELCHKSLILKLR